MIAEGYTNVRPDGFFHINELHPPIGLTQVQPEGKKLDAGKPSWSLIPKGILTQVVEVLTFGSKKYSRDNWMKVEPYRYEDALHRHIDAWRSGERRDPETNKHHLAHALCCLMFMLWLDQNTPE